jgi:aryl-alcohol dehydrogenase-like predicted oxidoreductase
MEYRPLGRSGLFVPVICFGAMTFGGDGVFKGIGATQEEEATKLVDICLEAGVNLFDTADMYSAGRSEEILGAAVAGRRDKLLIATKAFGPMLPGPNGLGLSRRRLIEACEASLKRLGTDYIDLYQMHNFDSLTPLEETLRALDDLVRAGKVRYVGHSNYAAWQLTKAAALAEKLNVQPFISQQIQYSLLHREAEFEMLPAGVDQGVGALLWSPLAQGYLSGKFRNAGSEPTRLAATGRLARTDDERARQIVDVLAEIVAAHAGATISQAALNYLVRKPGVSSIIIGARNVAQLRDNLGAATWSMSDVEVRRLDEASAVAIPYPLSHHRAFGRGRNPELPLQPIAD